MESRQTTDIDLSYRGSKILQSEPQVKRNVRQWTAKGIACLPFLFG